MEWMARFFDVNNQGAFMNSLSKIHGIFKGVRLWQQISRLRHHMSVMRCTLV